MRHPKELDEKALARIARAVRVRITNKHGVRAFIFLSQNTSFLEDLLRFTYLAVREELERELDEE